MQSPHNKSTRFFIPAVAGILLAMASPTVFSFERTYTYQDAAFLGGRSATLAPERNRIRIGDEVLELQTCSTSWSDMCVASEYFVFIVPHDVSKTNWNYEGINFERSIQSEIGDHRCLPKDGQQVVSVQRDATFTFYWSSQHQLLGWTLEYLSPDNERFVETYLDSALCATAD